MISVRHAFAIVFACIATTAFGDVISPSSTTVSVTSGQTISVSASVTNIADLYAFQFDWAFDPSILAAQFISEGPFLSSGGPTFFLSGTIDNVGGTITGIADTLLGPVSGVNGSGFLVSATFTAIATGISSFSLPNQIVLDSNLDPILPQTSTVPEPSSATFLLLALISLWSLHSFRRTVM